jgi:predicted Zn-dependent protease
VQAILRALQEPRTQVLADYQQRVTENPDDPQNLALLGSVLLRYNDAERARQNLEQASAKGIRLDRELAIAYLRLGQRDRARLLLARQSEVDPEDADSHCQLAKIFFQDGDLEQAERESRAALEIDPRLDEAYLTLAQVNERQGKRGESLLLLAQAMELQGRLEAALGQYQKAIAVFGPDSLQTEELGKKTEQLEQLVSVLRQQRRR